MEYYQIDPKSDKLRNEAYTRHESTKLSLRKKRVSTAIESIRFIKTSISAITAIPEIEIMLPEVTEQLDFKTIFYEISNSSINNEIVKHLQTLRDFSINSNDEKKAEFIKFLVQQENRHMVTTLCSKLIDVNGIIKCEALWILINLTKEESDLITLLYLKDNVYFISSLFQRCANDDYWDDDCYNIFEMLVWFAAHIGAPYVNLFAKEYPFFFSNFHDTYFSKCGHKMWLYFFRLYDIDCKDDRFFLEIKKYLNLLLNSLDLTTKVLISHQCIKIDLDEYKSKLALLSKIAQYINNNLNNRLGHYSLRYITTLINSVEELLNFRVSLQGEDSKLVMLMREDSHNFVSFALDNKNLFESCVLSCLKSISLVITRPEFSDIEVNDKLLGMLTKCCLDIKNHKTINKSIYILCEMIEAKGLNDQTRLFIWTNIVKSLVNQIKAQISISNQLIDIDMNNKNERDKYDGYYLADSLADSNELSRTESNLCHLICVILLVDESNSLLYTEVCLNNHSKEMLCIISSYLIKQNAENDKKVLLKLMILLTHLLNYASKIRKCCLMTILSSINFEVVESMYIKENEGSLKDKIKQVLDLHQEIVHSIEIF